MYYAIFEGTEAEGKAAVPEQYYKTLSSILSEIQGFISENGFESPHVARLGALVSVWEDVDAISRWRNEMTHLRIQQKASHGIYQDYRVRIGPELDPDSSNPSTDEASQIVVLYYRDNFEKTPEDNITSLIDSTTATELQSELLDSSVYLGSQTLWISSWQSEAAASKLANLLSSFPGGHVKLIAVKGITQNQIGKMRQMRRPDCFEASPVMDELALDKIESVAQQGTVLSLCPTGDRCGSPHVQVLRPVTIRER
jgi:heme-degrading monooxygenase HmoA